MVGLYPDSLLLQWIALGLIEAIVAAMAGGWLYREG
jgi:hypothetical protein